MPSNNKLSVAFDDVLWGVGEIARQIGRSRRQTQYLIDKGVIEVVRIPGAPKTLVTTRAKLSQNFADLTSEPTEKSNTA
jgi:hypothetical protein